MRRKERHLDSPEETREVACALAAALLPAIREHGLVVGLSGELGGGKTTFSRELCAALGVRAPVSSPTFVLEHRYEGAGVAVEHWDLYRLGAELPEELFEPVKPGVLRLIEWIERSSELSQCAGIHLTFQILGSLQRKLHVEWQQDSAFDTLLSATL